MDSPVSHAQVDKLGTIKLCHVHALQDLIGMALNVKHVLVQEFGVSQLMIVSVFLEIGMERYVSNVQLIPTGMVLHAFNATVLECGTL